VANSPPQAGLITLWRAVKDPELADILATGAFRSPAGIENKYFAATAGGAARYAMLAYGRWPQEGPYTLVATSVPRELALRAVRVLVDRRIEMIVVPTELLERLSSPVVMSYIPVPGR
jgi:hypothetical protein